MAHRLAVQNGFLIKNVFNKLMAVLPTLLKIVKMALTKSDAVGELIVNLQTPRLGWGNETQTPLYMTVKSVKARRGLLLRVANWPPLIKPAVAPSGL